MVNWAGVRLRSDEWEELCRRLLVQSDRRWGGGIPLLPSGLAMTGNAKLNIEVSDRTPDGQSYHVRLADSREVYTVDSTWLDVLGRLAVGPPAPHPKR